MADAALLPRPMTVAEFDAFEEAQIDDSLWELVDGVLVLMGNPTENHEQIAGNIGAPLKLAMDSAGCRTYQGGMRVQRAADGLGTDKTRPDIVVRCGPRQNRTFITDPVVVIKVLSPTTIDEDRGRKLQFYKSLPTVRHIALVYQDEMRVEHYFRDDGGFSSEALTSPQETLRFDAVRFAIALSSIYFDVLLPSGREPESLQP